MLVETVTDAAHLSDHWWVRPGWVPGTGMLAWHLTFEGETALHQLALTAQQALVGVEALDPVPPEWLHLNLATFGATTDVTDDCIRQAINAAHQQLNALGPLELSFSRTVVFAESIALRPDDSPALDGLRASLQDSVRQVRGPGAPPEPAAFVPHVSVAYANGPACGTEVVESLASAGLPDASPHPHSRGDAP